MHLASSARCSQVLSCYLICPNFFTHLASSARHGQVLSCYLICSNPFMHLASSTRCGQVLSCYLICPNSFMCLASSARCGQALPKGIVNLLLTSDHIIISCFSQPLMTIIITHSCMLVSLASIMPMLILLDVKAYKFTKLDGLNFYGSDGISMKAQTCNRVTQDWIGSLSPCCYQGCLQICGPTLCAVCLSHYTHFLQWQDVSGWSWGISLHTWLARLG